MSGKTVFAAKWQFNFTRRKVTQRMGAKLRSVARLADIPGSANVLLVTVQHELAETQAYPFHFYRARLKAAGVKFVELPVDAVPRGAAVQVISRNIKRIFFQPTLNMPGADAAAAIQTLLAAFPAAKVAFLDWFAPLHLHPAAAVAPLIDVYVKKQVFRDFSAFQQPVVGDTNLSDHYARKHGLTYPLFKPEVPDSIQSKLRLWSNFGLSPQMVDLFLSPLADLNGRGIDLHARLAANGDPWYKVMRQEAKNAVDRLTGLSIAQHGRVRRDQFFAELANSKLCFSPFGYGEICWRDYEAFATGSLLIKPSVEHLRVEPDIFVPDETYVAVPWDLDGLRDCILEHLSDHGKRSRIARAAHHRYRQWIEAGTAAEEVIALL